MTPLWRVWIMKKKTFCQDLCSIKGLALHQTMANMPLVINPSNIKVMLENTRRQKSGEKNGTTQRLIADDMSKFSSITNSYLCNMQASNCWLSSVIKSVHLENMASCSASFYCVKCVSLT